MRQAMYERGERAIGSEPQLVNSSGRFLNIFWDPYSDSQVVFTKWAHIPPDYSFGMSPLAVNETAVEQYSET